MGKKMKAYNYEVVIGVKIEADSLEALEKALDTLQKSPPYKKMSSYGEHCYSIETDAKITALHSKDIG